MNTIIILLVILAIVGIVILLKFIKSIIQAIIYGFLLILIFSFVIGYVLINDARTFANEFSKGENLYLLMEEGEIVSGFSMHAFNLSTAKFIKIKDINDLYQKKDYKTMLGKHYKLFILDIELIKDNMVSPIEFIKGKPSGQEMLQEAVIPMQEERATAFFLLTAYHLKNDPAYLLKGYRNGKIIIYPETIMFKIFKLRVK